MLEREIKGFVKLENECAEAYLKFTKNMNEKKEIELNNLIDLHVKKAKHRITESDILRFQPTINP